MGPFVLNPQTSQAIVLVMDKVSVLATEITPTQILLQTGVLGVVALGTMWGIKTEFIWFGPAVRRIIADHEKAMDQLALESDKKDERNDKKDLIIEEQRQVIVNLSQQVSGHTLPAMTRLVEQRVPDPDTLQALAGFVERLEQAASGDE